MKSVLKTVLIFMAVLFIAACGEESSSDKENNDNVNNNKPVIGQIGHTIMSDGGNGGNQTTNYNPVVTDIGHRTVNNLPTHVWARVSDQNGLSDIQSVTVVQSVRDDNKTFQFKLYDDGSHGDTSANDGKFEYSMVENVDARYYTTSPGHLWTVTATDKSGAKGSDTW